MSHTVSTKLLRQSALRCMLLQIIWAAHCFHWTFLIHVPAGQVTRVTSQFPFHTTSVENQQWWVLELWPQNHVETTISFLFFFWHDHLWEQDMGNHNMSLFVSLHSSLPPPPFELVAQFQQKHYSWAGIFKSIEFLQLLGRKVTQRRL